MRLLISRPAAAVLLALGCLLLSVNAATAAQDYRYADGWSAPGLSLDASTPSRIDLTWSLAEWSLGDLELDGRTQSTVSVPGLMLQNEAGAPDLPGLGRFLAIPEGAQATVRITGSRLEIVSDVEIAPAAVIPKETEDGLVHERNQAIYTANAFYPAQIVRLSDVRQVRGVDAVILGVSPFQYNPVTRELRVYRDLEISVEITGGNGQYGEDRLRSRWWDPILADVFLNHEVVPEAQPRVVAGSRETGYEYVIICPDQPDFTAWADSLRNWRTEQGILTGVYTVPEVGGNSTAAIESFVDDAYANWDIPPAAVLLLADYGTGDTGILSPMWDGYCVSDNIYGDTDGDDLPDVVMARITARDAGELETMIGKMLAYERQPPTNPGFYQNPIMAGGWQTERWFILCEEVVYGYLAHVQGKTPVREYAIYDGTPGSAWSSNQNTSMVVDYFGPNGLGYIPATPQHLTDWGGNATRINNDINAGSFILQHRDHGDVDGWGEPNYRTPHLSGLDNDDLTFVFSINCLTGMYDGSQECFTEVFHRHQKGALGLIAASEVSYSFVNDTYIFGLYDYFWPDFDPGYGADGPHDLKPAFGNAAGKYYLEVSNWPYNPQHKVYTDHLFHHHGDAFMTVFSEIPEPLAVTHGDALLSGLESFTVTADAGALIGLSVAGELIGTAVGTGAPVNVPIVSQMPGEDLIVTVTQQNKLRYRAAVPIIPPSGPFVVFDACAVDDAAQGNGNGQLDYGEQVALDVTLHNVGLQVSTGVSAVLATEDPLVTLLDAEAAFDDIPADGTVSLAGAFTLAADLAIPDGHRIDFTLEVTDADSNYTSYFDLTAHAPVLAVAGYEVADGDDGVLDPGETADLVITFGNEGTATVGDLTVQVTSLNPNVTLSNDTFPLPTLQPEGTRATTFGMTASEDAQIGEPVEFQVDVTGPDYEFHTTLALTIGLTFEDFEAGTFLAFPWEMGGSQPWTMETADPYEGDYAARSGDIGDSQSSSLSLELDVLAPGEITFWYKVSSESSYDFLRFKIDGNELGSWSGTVPWSQATFPVTAGTHTFTWAYTKDSSVSNGSDCGWVDMIIFPAVGLPPMPTMAVSPANLDASVEIGDTATGEIQVQNLGEGELAWFVTIATDDQRDAPATEPQLYKKGEEVPIEGTPPTDGQGGPDQFGYTWIDSDEPGGPVYEWVEINDVGVVPGSADDGNYGPFDLGFAFPYYGVFYDQVRICTNGWISFTSTSTAYSNASIPNTSAPNHFIAPFWDDMNPSTSAGAIYYHHDEAGGRFIVEWDDVNHYSASDPETFQVILYPDGRIVYQYAVVQAGTSCTVGIENLDGTDGLQMVYNAAYLHPEMAIEIAADEPWVSVDPMSGTVAPLGDATLTVTFSAEDVPVGDYAGTITVHGNDPDNPTHDIPVTLHVYQGVGVEDGGLPRRYALGHAQPNPFNPATTIAFALPRDSQVRLRIYDVAGRLVASLVDGPLTAGNHAVTWRGEDRQGRRVASGTYYYRLEAGDFTATEKMVLVK